jgi:hypothetical protein
MRVIVEKVLESALAAKASVQRALFSSEVWHKDIVHNEEEGSTKASLCTSKQWHNL